MESERLTDMLDKYGELCLQETAAEILCMSTRTIRRMVKDGRLRAVDARITNLKSVITPHYFRHNYVTLLYEAGIDPLIAMKIVGHTDYQTTANIYTHLGNETLRRAAVDMRGVFDPKGKEVQAGARDNGNNVVPWAGKFGMKKAK